MDRRTSLKWMLAASAAMPLLDQRVLAGQDSGAPKGSSYGEPDARGYGTDPDLIRVYRPGDLWPLTLSGAQRRTATVLCDIILPADDSSPSASAVGVVEFLDEWVSAPYPRQRADRELLLAGLQWLDEESDRRHAQPFTALDEARRHAVCEDICNPATTRTVYAEAARFFSRFRDLTCGGFYSTPEGRKDIGYVGNVPQVTFEGAAPEVLRKLGLTAT